MILSGTFCQSKDAQGSGALSGQISHDCKLTSMVVAIIDMAIITLP